MYKRASFIVKEATWCQRDVLKMSVEAAREGGSINAVGPLKKKSRRRRPPSGQRRRRSPRSVVQDAALVPKVVQGRRSSPGPQGGPKVVQGPQRGHRPKSGPEPPNCPCPVKLKATTTVN